MTLKATVIIEKDENGYYAYVPELEGCQSQGDTLDEVLKNIQEAFELYVETLDEEDIQQVLSTTVLTTTLEAELA